MHFFVRSLVRLLSHVRWNGQDGAIDSSFTLHLQKAYRVGRLIPRALLLDAALPKPASRRRTGFWLSNWVTTHPNERVPMMNELAQMVADGKLKEPETEIVELRGDEQQLGETIREVMRKAEGGKGGKKVLLRFVEE